MHAGRSSNAGHYYAIVKVGAEKWFLCNDASVSQLSRPGTEFDVCGYINGGVRSSFQSDTPYMLSYERVKD